MEVSRVSASIAILKGIVCLSALQNMEMGEKKGTVVRQSWQERSRKQTTKGTFVALRRREIREEDRERVVGSVDGDRDRVYAGWTTTSDVRSLTKNNVLLLSGQCGSK